MKRSIVARAATRGLAGTNLTILGSIGHVVMQIHSLGCVKAHKATDKCDGRRCKTAYVSQSELSDNHLLSGQ